MRTAPPAVPVLLVLAAAAVAVVACSSSTGPGKTPAFTLATDAAAYSAMPGQASNGNPTYSLTVIATFKNMRDVSVSLGPCPAVDDYEVKEPAGSGKPVYNQTGGCLVGGPKLIVDAGASRVDTLELSGPSVWTVDKQPVGDVTGSFELVLYPNWCDASQVCTSDTVTSNVFTIAIAHD
jgi:hypothetical protein